MVATERPPSSMCEFSRTLTAVDDTVRRSISKTSAIPFYRKGNISYPHGEMDVKSWLPAYASLVHGGRGAKPLRRRLTSDGHATVLYHPSGSIDCIRDRAEGQVASAAFAVGK